MNFNDVALLHEQGKVSDKTMGYCIEVAIRDEHPFWRVEAIKHPNSNEVHLDMALNDSYLHVRRYALKIKKERNLS